MVDQTEREPLGALSLNTTIVQAQTEERTPVNSQAKAQVQVSDARVGGPSTPSSSSTSTATPASASSTRKLAPIFLSHTKRRTPNSANEGFEKENEVPSSLHSSSTAPASRWATALNAHASGSGSGSGSWDLPRKDGAGEGEPADGSPVSKKRVRLEAPSSICQDHDHDYDHIQSHCLDSSLCLSRDSSTSSRSSLTTPAPSSSSSSSSTTPAPMMDTDVNIDIDADHDQDGDSDPDARSTAFDPPFNHGQYTDSHLAKPHQTHSHVRMHSIHDWFLPSSSSTYERVKEAHRVGGDHFSASAEHGKGDARAGEVASAPAVWRRGRKRLGLPSMGRGGVLDYSNQRLSSPQYPYLSTLVTSLLPYHPLIPPSLLLLPSIHPPTGRPREFAPPLSLAFNHAAKLHDVSSARSNGVRRLIAVAGEEGGIRILDTDEGLGNHREEKGFWWRAHGNAVFDLKWSADDTRILTASGDQSTRLHALTTPTPTLIATLRGHTSSVKTSVFFDPSRSSIDPSDSSIIATGGRDGNILIYDVRCRGRRSSEPSSDYPIPHSLTSAAAAATSGSSSNSGSGRRSSRERYADGVPGFAAQSDRGMELDPVMTIRGAHGDGRRGGSSRTATRSVTSLVALQSMPGILASGGSFDGIVKLWDLRFPAPTTRSPDPRPTCTSVGSLADPTLLGHAPSRRARSINAMCESPATGDLYALCGDSKVHSLRPSSANTSTSTIDDFAPNNKEDLIDHKTYSDPSLLVSSFYIRIAVSPDGRYLSSGSCKGGAMTWDTQSAKNSQKATRLGMGMGGVVWPEGKEREVCAVDWGKDMLAATSDDLATRIWRSNRDAARWLRDDPISAGGEWIGAI